MATQFLIEKSAGETLLKVARQSVTQYVLERIHYRPDPRNFDQVLQRSGSSFVTFTHNGRLRGCIGTTKAHFPLVQDVAYNAVAAASRDPRFTPISSAELDDVHLEVTLLTPPQQITYPDYATLLRLIRIGTDGVILEWGEKRGLLLPQVWVRIPDPGQFLSAICYKAQIPLAELQREPSVTAVYTFQVQHFHEPGYQPPGD